MKESSQATKPKKTKRRKYRIPKHLILYNTSDDVSAFGDVDDGSASKYEYLDESTDCTDSMFATSASSSTYYQQHDFVSIRLETSFEGNQSLESNQSYNDKYQILIHDMNNKKHAFNDHSHDDVNEYNCGLELDRTTSTKEIAESWTMSTDGNSDSKICTEIMTEKIKKDIIGLKPSNLTSRSKKSSSNSIISRKSNETKQTKSQRFRTNHKRSTSLAKDYREGKKLNHLKSIEGFELKPKEASPLNNEKTQTVKVVAPHDLMPGCSIKVNVHGKDIRAIVVSNFSLASFQLCYYFSMKIFNLNFE